MMTASLKENLSYFNQQFDGSADFIVRQFQITGTDAALLTLEGMVNKQVIGSGRGGHIRRCDAEIDEWFRSACNRRMYPYDGF